MTENTPGEQPQSVLPLAPRQMLGIVSHKLHYVHNNEYYTDGGFADYVEGLSAHFRQTVLVVPVIKALDKEVKNLRKVSYPGCKLCPLPGYAVRTAKAWLLSPLIRRFVRRSLRNCDVVNVRLFSMCAMAALHAVEAMNKPIFLSLVGQVYFGYPSGLRALLRRQMETMVRHHLTFVHGWYLVDVHHLDPAMCVPTYSSTFHLSDVRKRHNSGPVKDEPIRLIFVGRLDPAKGVDFLLKALAAQAEFKQQFQLEIVGDGVFRQSLTNLTQQLGLQQMVTFHGYIPHGEKMDRLMGAAHAMVFTPLHEGAPKVVTEAMRFGLPIIASRVGAIPTVIQDGINGWLVDPGDVEQIVAKLHTLSQTSPSDLGEVSKRNLTEAAEYTVEQVSRAMVKTLIDRGLLWP